MNPLITSVFAFVACAVAGLLADRAPRGEARYATLGAAAITLGAAPLVALHLLTGGSSATATLGPLLFRADALVGTMLLPLAMVAGAVALGIPRGEASSRRSAATAWVLASLILALVSDNLLLLCLAEALGAAVTAWGLDPRQGRPGRIYLGASVVLMAAGLGLAIAHGEALRSLVEGGPLPVDVALILLAAVLVRLGVAPFHSGLSATMRGALEPGAVLLAAPLGGVPLLVRAVGPALEDGATGSPIVIAVLCAAALAALLALVQRDLGRTGAFLVSALNGLVVAGNLQGGEAGLLGGELLWAASVLSCGGFVLALLMVVRRLGAVDLARLHALHQAAPQLSLLFLVLAMSLAGVPGSLEFIAADLLLNGATRGGLAGLSLAVLTLAAIGYSALRLSFHVAYGRAPTSRWDLDILPRERMALLMVTGTLVAGGVAPGLLPLVAKASTLAVGH